MKQNIFKKILYTIYNTRYTKLEILFLIILCSTALFLRSYALYRDFIFAYDQGRDALAVEQILRGNLTLIGPVTGLDGVYLGPFWTYLLVPLYVVGLGSPIVPAYVMIMLHVSVTLLLYVTGKRFFHPVAGGIAAILFAFSQSNIAFSRWLSNPTPLPFFSLLLFVSVYIAFQKHSRKLFIVAGMLLGICLQLEAANAVTYILALGVFFNFEYLRHKNRKQIFGYMAAFTLGTATLLLPQGLFELKHNFLSTRGLIHSFATSHDVTVLESLPRRLPLLFHLYAKGIFPHMEWVLLPVLLFCLMIFLVHRKELLNSRWFRLLLCWFCIPFLFHLLYTGNHGNFWDYYIIGQHLVLYLLIACMFAVLYRHRRLFWIAIITVSLSITCNLWQWWPVTRVYADRISYSLELEAASWVIDSSGGEPFGVWVYTPSAQDESERYVFSLLKKRRGVSPEEHVEQQPLIYLVVEDDPVFWKRHGEWITERLKFGTLVAKEKFGAITVYKIKNAKI